MSLQNLPENLLYSRLPDGLIQLDEQGLIQAICGGIQDRLEDVRSYSKKFELFFGSSGLPEEGDNVVMISYTTEQGKLVTRSLDIEQDTPVSTDTAGLRAWAVAQTGVDDSLVQSVAYGVDLYRRVDASILHYLASSIGAVLYATSLRTGTTETRNQQQILESYFPRLKLKGTVQSFDALGRLIGFDDVRMAPLWGRVSARLPNDPGSPINEPDFTEVPEYQPRQKLGVFYDPHVMDDGVFYSWSGTVSADPANKSFYTQVINGYNPWVKVVRVSDTVGVQHPSGSFTLAGGAAHTKAQATPTGSNLKFEALGEGESFNGLAINMAPVDSGSNRLVEISDRLSSAKYRTSYFNLSMTVTDEHAAEVYGVSVAKKNPDLAKTPTLTSDGTAQSPFRPWKGGSVSAGTISKDYLVMSGTGPAVAVHSSGTRTQATIQDRQLNTGELVAAGIQAVQIFDEVRSATRFPHRAAVGILNKDDAKYAAYAASSILFTTQGSGTSAVTSYYSGTSTGYPRPTYNTVLEVLNDHALNVQWASTVGGVYQVQYSDNGTAWFNAALPVTATSGTTTFSDVFGVLTFPATRIYRVLQLSTSGTAAYSTETAAGSLRLTPETDTTDASISRHRDALGKISVTYNGSTHSYTAQVASTTGEGLRLKANWTTTTTEVIRVEPKNQVETVSASMEPVLNCTVFDNWEVLSGWVDLVGKSKSGSALYDLLPGNGLYVDLVGTGSTAPYQGTMQTKSSFDFVSGRTYKLTLVLAGNQRMNQAGFITYALITNSILSQQSVTIDNYLQGFTAYEFTFVAGSTASGKIQITHSVPFSPVVGTLLGEVILEDVTSSAVMLDDDFDGVLLSTPVKANYQLRPEDEQGDYYGENFVTETADEYPWMRPLQLGGELVGTDDHHDPIVEDVSVSVVESDTSIKDQGGVEYSLYARESTRLPMRIVTEERSTSPYVLGRQAIGFSGEFRDLGTLTDDDRRLVPASNQILTSGRVCTDDLDLVLESGYKLYQVGLVNGVLMADPDTFNSVSHRTGLMAWIPFNEHPDDDLVVADRASYGVFAAVSGLIPSHRDWDSYFGWYLNLTKRVSISYDTFRPVGTDLTLSFWLKFNSTEASGSSSGSDILLIKYGLLEVSMTSAGVVSVSLPDSSGTRVYNTIGTATGVFKNFVARFDGAGSVLDTFIGTSSQNLTKTSVSCDVPGFGLGVDRSLVFTSGLHSVGYADARIWNSVKTDSDLARVHAYSPVNTAALVEISHILTLNRVDRYGLKVLGSGRVYPSQMPAWVKSAGLKRIVRYDGLGRYSGETRYKEVGLSGGRAMPSTYVLGQQLHPMSATGTTVVSTRHGALPGFGQQWLDQTVPGQYLVSTSPPGTIGRTYTAGTASVSGTLWPNPVVQQNVIREQVWIVGDDGYVYEVYMEADPTPRLVSKKLTKDRLDSELKLNKMLQEFKTTGSVSVFTAQGTIYPNNLMVTAGSSVAIDDGVGNLVPSGQITGGTLNTSTGQVTILTTGVTKVSLLHPKSFRTAFQPTGAIVDVVASGTHLTVSATGSVYQRAGGMVSHA